MFGGEKMVLKLVFDNIWSDRDLGFLSSKSSRYIFVLKCTKLVKCLKQFMKYVHSSDGHARTDNLKT